jgi:uncharacterized protein (TIGR00725 family)
VSEADAHTEVRRLPIVGVMGASAAPWAEYAAPLGAHLAERGVHLLTGGGTGTMAAVAAAFCAVAARRGVSIGIVPTAAHPERGFVALPGYPNPWVEVPIMTPLGTFSGSDDALVTRNHVNVLSADAIVALPGAVGTHNEIRLARRFAKPLVLFGPAAEFAVYAGAIPHAASIAEVAAFLDAALGT